MRSSAPEASDLGAENCQDPVRGGAWFREDGPPAVEAKVQNGVFFAIDTRVLRCYKTLKEKLFGGESPIELPKALRE